MPEELERELERVLSGLPGPSAKAGERARRAALDALPAAVDEPTRRWRGPVLLAAAAVAVLAAAVGVTLAATGTPPFAPARHHPPARPPVPAAHVTGLLATYVDGRLWLGHTHGRRFSAVELSPGGLYVAVGQPGRLAVYTPDLSRLVWSHRVEGTVVAMSWRPIGTQIAYVVHTRRGNILHLIQADGDTDQVVDTQVAPVTPSWRWDSQALAYVGAGGGVAIRDLIHNRSVPIKLPQECPVGAVTSIAFGPVGPHQSWVAGTISGNVFAANTATARAQCLAARPVIIGPEALVRVCWTRSGELLVAHSQFIARLQIVRGHVIAGGYATAPLGVSDIAPAPDGRGVLVALIASDRLDELLARLPPRTGEAHLGIIGTVERLPLAPPANYFPKLFWR